MILEGAGHNLTAESWVYIIDAISSVSGENSEVVLDRTTAAWASSCALGFRCLKLIVDGEYVNCFHNEALLVSTNLYLLDPFPELFQTFWKIFLTPVIYCREHLVRLS